MTFVALPAQGPTSPDAAVSVLSQRQLIWRQFKKHRVAHASFIILITLYIAVLFAEFVAPYDPFGRNPGSILTPPTALHFVDDSGAFSLRPFVYGSKVVLDRQTFQRTYAEDRSKRYPVEFLVHGDVYPLLGFIETDVHLFGVAKPGLLALAGTDMLGRDLLSRMLFGARTSLFVGLLGVTIGFVLGLILGGASGYYGGAIDTMVQRLTEFLQSLPTLPLWMALVALVPKDWSPLQVYFAISTVLAIVGWTGLARVIRGKLLSLREEDYVMAARICGVSEPRIIVRHLLPGFMSYLIVHLTLAIPQMILGEVSLSFLGLGLRPPAVSLGTLLLDAQNIQTVTLNPWLLIPGGLVVIIVIAFNFLGDGLRDAVDPYRQG